MKRLYIIIALFLFFNLSFAQENQEVNEFKRELGLIKTKVKRQARESGENNLSPYFFRIIDPEVYYSSALKGIMTLDDNYDENDRRDRLNKEINNCLAHIYLYEPQKVKFSSTDIESEKEVIEKNTDILIPSKKVEEILVDELADISAKDIDDDIGEIKIDVERPNFWKFTGTASLQFTQNYFSENWYKGGNNSQNLLSALILQANYNDQKKISWENKLEMRLGFMTTTSDTCHSFLTSNDKLNLYSKLGVKAAKAWYYTLTAEANTQFLPGYKANDRKKYSAFFSPLDVYVSLGLDFKPTFKNGNTFSLALLPISYKFRFISQDDENIHNVYNMLGINSTNDIGSKVEVNARLKLARNFFWKTRLYYYTPYDYVEAEWENSFTYAFSKYINAEVYSIWRFDDNRDRKYYDDNLGYFQFKEYFTLGLTYNF